MGVPAPTARVQARLSEPGESQLVLLKDRSVRKRPHDIALVLTAFSCAEGVTGSRAQIASRPGE